jgi:2,4-dienoyl-CoA reductase-like NADH-dependent reductase (Old Yellow Enzyme family)
MKRLFETYDLGDPELRNRFMIAPMTRASRPDCVADEEMAGVDIVYAGTRHSLDRTRRVIS